MSGPAFVQAIRDGPRGLLLDLVVTPGSSPPCFPGRFDAWRNRITCRVGAPAEGGRANREVERLVATFFSCAPGDVRVVRGAATPLKTVAVRGVTIDQATDVLRGKMERST